MQFGLGRLHKEDTRDKGFLMKTVLPKKEVVDISKRYWNANGWWGDQQDTPMCVGYAWAHWVEDGPVTHKGEPPIIKPSTIYWKAQQLDEWEGDNYDGTSVRAGAKALAEEGFINSYLWAFNVEDVITALLTSGPVVVGTNWYESMFTPNAGLIQVTGEILGGHAYLLDGVNRKTGLLRIKNSWGRGWGVDGFAYITFKDMDRLIKEDGEACLAIERK